MARTRIPNALEMKQLKYGGRSDAERDAMAEVLRAAGRRSEAVLLFEGRPEAPFLEEEKAWALEQGNAFHLLSLRRLGKEIEAAEIRACAERAESKERWLDARQLWLALEDEAAVRRIAEHLPVAYRPAEDETAGEDAKGEAP